MRVEDTALDGETERALGRRSGQAGVEESVEEHLLDRAVVTSREDLQRAQTAYDAVERIMRGDGLDELQAGALTAHELAALRALAAAAGGRDRQAAHRLYAEDRRDLLEQALAQLQPLLAAGSDPHFASLHERHGELVQQVVELRAELMELADSQDELVRRPEEETAGDAPEDEDEGDGDGEDEDEDGGGGEGEDEGLDAETEADTESESESDTDTDTESESESESDTDTEAGPAPASPTAPRSLAAATARGRKGKP